MLGLRNLFSRSNVNIEERSSTLESETYYGGLITSFFGSATSLTEEEAQKIPAVTAALELITSTVSQLPIYLYQEDSDQVSRVIDDRREFLLNEEPNEMMNGSTLKKRIVKDYLLYGASYNKVDRDLNDISGIYNLDITKIQVKKYRYDGYKLYGEINLFEAGQNGTVKFDPDELAIILRDSNDGLTSTGVLVNNEKILQTALGEIDYSNGVLKNGAVPLGVLQAASRLSTSAITNLRNSFANIYSGSDKAGKTIILEDGLEYKPLSMKPNELDLTNSKKSTISEIARVFNIPESMINSSANKYASNEQNNISFLQYCLSPIITSIENALNKSLLLESEKQNGYYFRFDTSEILRTTEKDKIDTISKGIDTGLYTMNEGRKKLELPPLETDYMVLSLGKVFYNPATGDMIIPNTGSSGNLNDPKSFTPPNANLTGGQTIKEEDSIE